MIVYVEKKVLEGPAIVSDDNFRPVKKFCTFRGDYDDISNPIDFIICLGGDGTLLYASSLLQAGCECLVADGPTSREVPGKGSTLYRAPSSVGNMSQVMAFHLGSLGFLPFNFENFQSQVTHVI